MYQKIKGVDLLIGETLIDIENRIFHPTYAYTINKNYLALQIEKRGLYNPSSYGPQGSIRMWVELVKDTMEGNYPLIQLQGASPEKFEIRVVFWNTIEV